MTPEHRTREHPEATDPLRQRLPRPNAIRLLGHCKSPAERSIYGYIEALEAIAREALAAAPEPEWEYRARTNRWFSGPAQSPSPSAADARTDGIHRYGPDAFLHIERRRKAGEWDAVPDDD